MANSLIENTNGQYYHNAAILTGHPETVKVIVEDELDVPFWLDILSSVVRNKKFNIKPYTYENNEERILSLTKGKQHILKKAREHQFNTHYIGCVDSDYDYLLRATNTDGQLIENCPYLLQTYAYSIENLLCYPETLGLLCCKATKELTDFDIAGYIEEVSTIIYPLLIWALFLESKGNNEFSATKWDEIFPCDSHIYKSENAKEEILNSLKQNVETAIASIKNLHSEEIDDMQEFETQLINNEFPTFTIPIDSYLYVRGHDFYKFIINTVLKAICQKTKKEHIQQIKNAQVGSTEIGNRINQYNKEVIDIEVLLKTNYEYKHHAPLFSQIEYDINALFP